MFRSLIRNSVKSARYGSLSCLLFSLLFTLTDWYAVEVELSSATITNINTAFDAGTLNSEKLVQLYLHRV
jgi:hypothetical protein